MILSRLVLAAAVAACLAACAQQDGPADVDGVSTPASDAEAPIDAVETADPLAGDEPERPEVEESGFDLAAIPVSERPLGDFPYFSLPEGYHHPNRPIPVVDFDRVAFWTGDRLEWVEGRIHQSLIHAERGGSFSRHEVMRNIDHQVAEAGGVQVADSRVPREALDAWRNGQQASRGLGGISNHPTSTWVVRRPDRDIWVHMNASTASGAWLIAETAPFEPTARLLPSSELKAQLDAQGRVAVEVNFATDSADILPESRPQIEQILELLRADPDLRLSIEGHTDDTGGANHNQRLSEARAQSVVAALTGQGVAASRLSAAGFGQDRPVADNATEAGRAKNRRVELVRQ